MSKSLQVQLPDDIVDNVGETVLATLAREALLVKLYADGDVSSGLAAQALGISRREFLDTLGRYGVTIFDDGIDLERESQRG